MAARNQWAIIAVNTTKISGDFAVALTARSFFHPRNLVVYGHDVAMAFFAFLAAFGLRLGWSGLEYQEGVVAMAAAFAAVAAVVYPFTGLNRHMWEYVSPRDALNVLRTASIVVLVYLPAAFLVTRLEALPRSLPIIVWFVLVAFLAGPRLLYRLVHDRHIHGLLSYVPGGTPILLVGAGPEAEHFLRAIGRNPNSGINVLGMVTSTPARIGQVILGVDVLGRDTDIPRIVAALERKDMRPEKLVLVRSNIDGAEVRRLLTIADEVGCSLARVPPPTDVLAYDGADTRPRPIAIEDLLGRPQTRLDRAAMAAMIKGRRVLITGAGGSIGAELVRQIARAEPAHLSLLDNSEYMLYTVDQAAREKHPALAMSTILADVRDATRLREIFAREKPELVFHAAALKHVPMVETNPLEGLLTNAVGTRNVADAVIAAGVRTMVLISTDKAVNPSNVMGAAKRVAEIYCQAADLRRAGTRFITVRFGNVLGSTGSVVPLFQRQLESGVPLTVTHPDMERYFMTVREAVELVLQASALGQGRNDEGAIYVLDMGQPVKIMDLAKQMIRLAGRTLGVNADIKVTGLRPGEKLTEELFHGEEPPAGTDMAGVLIARPRTVDHAVIAAQLAALEDACRSRNEIAALSIVSELVPELRRAAPPSIKPQLKVVK